MPEAGDISAEIGCDDGFADKDRRLVDGRSDRLVRNFFAAFVDDVEDPIRGAEAQMTSHRDDGAVNRCDIAAAVRRCINKVFCLS